MRQPSPTRRGVEGAGGPSEVPTRVTRRSYGLELFAPPARRKAVAVSGKRAEALAKLGIVTVQDLLQHYPRYHVDRTQLKTVRELGALARGGHSGEVQVHARVKAIGRPFRTPAHGGGRARARRVLVKGKIADETGEIDVTWFNQEWVARALRPGAWAFFYGRLGVFRGRLQMTAPRFELVRSGREPFNVGRIVPVYPATAELPSDGLRRLMWDTLARAGEIADPVPPDILRRLGLMGRAEALRLIHFPETKDDVLRARRRIVFDEVFTLQLGLVYRKRKLERTVRGIAHDLPGPDSLAHSFVADLPFEPTRAQRRACDEVALDMSRGFPMHRLVEGEVGSGKTVVALYACLIAIASGHQAAFMAPTEVLAEQHFLTVSELLERAFGADEARNLFASVSRRPVVRLLTGSTPAAQRAALLAEVASGQVDLLIGTHALIQDAVDFDDLSLAVVDEQHRFGVHQRKSLRAKGNAGEPDVLVMTATPIPRTLAVTIYGDLDVSILDELPKGRQPVTTRIARGEDDRRAAYETIRAEVRAGRQAFVVYALRDESDKVELRSAKSEARRLAEEVWPDLAVGLVHGDMRSEEKEVAMTEFRAGRTQVLVATTVIEVGIDVPNATVMLIEDAERFGLAQLHQLRGRIGRGEYPSLCVLATDVDLAAEDDPGARAAAERLSALERTGDGFELALTDLEQRGEGQLFGARQSGMPQLKLARVLEHQDVVKQARDLAVAILDEDPALDAYEHVALEREMRSRFPERALDVVQSG
jgi:ATP-dependent DNA helicase RecG